MPQFLLLGYDGNDDQALQRRLNARNDHIALGDKLVESGKMKYGAAILDADDKMIGSVLVLEYESREMLDEWLKIEPYVVGEVWKDISIIPCKVGPSFEKLHF